MAPTTTGPAGDISLTPVASRKSRVASHVKSQPASSAGLLTTVILLIAGQVGITLTADEAVAIVAVVTKITDLLAARLS